jgi:hypothetical protein
MGWSNMIHVKSAKIKLMFPHEIEVRIEGERFIMVKGDKTFSTIITDDLISRHELLKGIKHLTEI